MKRPPSRRRYIAENVYSRCGQAVTKLAERGLIPRPELPDSETEIREWWLVSPASAGALRAAGEPVIQFCELWLWGRTRLGALKDDPALAQAAKALPEPETTDGRAAQAEDLGAPR